MVPTKPVVTKEDGYYEKYDSNSHCKDCYEMLYLHWDRSFYGDEEVSYY